MWSAVGRARDPPALRHVPEEAKSRPIAHPKNRAISRQNAQTMPTPKTEQEYKAAVKDVAQAVAEKLEITADLAVRSHIDPKIFWKWTKKWVNEDYWTPGPNGKLVRIYPPIRFTRREYAEMRAEFLRKREEREQESEEARQLA
jgi:hypothetical protein